MDTTSLLPAGKEDHGAADLVVGPEFQDPVDQGRELDHQFPVVQGPPVDQGPDVDHQSPVVQGPPVDQGPDVDHQSPVVQGPLEDQGALDQGSEDHMGDPVDHGPAVVHDGDPEDHGAAVVHAG